MGKNKTIQIVADDELKAQARKQADALGMTVSAMSRMFVKRGLAEAMDTGASTLPSHRERCTPEQCEAIEQVAESIIEKGLLLKGGVQMALIVAELGLMIAAEEAERKQAKQPQLEQVG